MSLINFIDFTSLGDERGSLVAFEGNKNIPFDIKRAYCIFGTQKNIARGFHAHIQLTQVAVCISGKCRIVLDNGNEKKSVWLNSATRGVLIESMVWHEMHDFSNDCVLLVLANAHYDEGDYIRSYQKFIEVVNNDS